MNFEKYFKNKKVIITGHTGFKGSWLTLWLKMYGAKIVGVSKDIPTNPSHFNELDLKKKIVDKRINLQNLKKLKNLFVKTKPDFVFHLAAQAIVKKAYLKPLETWMSNLNGTLNVLESLKSLNKKCIAVIITSDKVYKNIETKRGYKETDLLGGYDPYSASKGAAEFLINSYVKSYFGKKNSKITLGIARAGNVIGGGDWSLDRLIPDCMRSWSKGKKVFLRKPNPTRPWQHVLEVLAGYIILAIKLKDNKKLHGEAFNFGPAIYHKYRVIDVVKIIKKDWKDVSWKKNKKNIKHYKESNLLKLNSKKSNTILNWKCILSFNQTTKLVLSWYKSYYSNAQDVKKTSLQQLMFYENLLKKKNL